MTKNFTRRVAVGVATVVTLLAALPTSAVFASNTTTYPQDTTLFLSTPGITLTILAGSESDSLSVTGTQFTVSVNAGGTFTVRYPSPSPGTLANNALLNDCNLVGGNNEVSVTSTQSPATFTPNTTTCAAQGNGGGGSSTPTISLFQPNSGSMAAGDNYQIIWSINGTGIISTRISLSTDSGANYSTLVASQPDGSYIWAVPSTATTHARIRVEGLNSSGNVLATAASSNDFTITVPTVVTGGGGGGGGAVPPPASQGNQNPPGQTVAGGVSSVGAHSRADANNILPLGYPVDALVKLADDGNSKTEADSSVYYIGLDAKRHPFVTKDIYNSWYKDFSEVINIPGSTLASIPLGKPILVRPGTRWVKIQSDPKTYYVEYGYNLRWIQDEAAARLLGGANWNKNIIDVDPTLFTYFTTGTDLTEANLATSWPNGQLARASGSGDMYYMTATAKRRFSSQEAFDANHFQQKFVQETPATSGWVSMTSGAAIGALEDALFSLMH